MNEVAIKLNIKCPRDWGRVKAKRFKELGGRAILSYHNDSLFCCLKAIYEGIT